MQVPFCFSGRLRCRRGFTLIEMAIVLVIVGMVISIVAAILPSLIQSAKMKKTRALMEKAEYALEGYMTANGRLPYADSDGDGKGDSGTYFGSLPFRDLGLSSGDDAWTNRMEYGVYSDLTTSNTGNFCSVLQAAAISATDTSKLHINQSGTLTNMAFVIVSGGAKDIDGSNGFFDGRNGDNNAEYDDPERIVDTTYDDLMLARSFNEVSGVQRCSGSSGGSGGSGGGGGSSGAENTNALCSDGIDNDGDGYVDCFDQDCCRAGLTACPQCPPSTNVQINTGSMSDGTAGQSYSHTFQATGGSGHYYWYLDGISPGISGLSLNLWNGTLSGSIDNCAGVYTVNVRVEDRYDSSKTDSHAFTLTVNSPVLSVSPAPGGGGAGNPDFTVDRSTFSQVFTVTGGHVGVFNWTVNWQGSDPGGFQIVRQSDSSGKLWKSGATTAGNYSFTLTATDSSCSTNTITTNTYTMTISPSGIGAPYTAGMVGEWRFDECSWNGTTGEVKDSGPNALDGTAVGNATTIGSGHLCRAGYFDGSGDYVRVPSTDELKITSPLTISLWVKVFKNASDWVRLAGKGNPTNRNYGLWLATNGTILFQIYSDGGYGNAQTTTRVNDGKWHHVVGVYDQSAMKVYIDNVEKKSVSYSQVPRTSDDPFTIGYAGFHACLNGCIDEVMLFNVALPATSSTGTSVETLFTLTRPSCSGDCYTGPLSEYRMENFPWSGTAGEVIDSGSGGNNGVASARGSGAIPAQTTPSNGKVCRAGVFSRVDSYNGGYLDMGDPADGDLDPGSRPWTISAWVKWDGSSGENIIYNKENLYEARVNNGYVQYAWRPHWAWDAGNSFPIAKDTWTYVTTVYDGHRQILYKNGKEVFSRAQAGSIGANGSKFLVGARGDTNPHNFFGGQIDELRIYDRALSINEIVEDMNETRDCASDSVYITTTSLPSGTINSPYSTILTATGGSPPYGWDIVAPNPVTGLSIVPSTGRLHGTVNVCAGNHDITVRVTDATGSMDERTFTLTVNNGTLTITPASPQTFNCSTSTFYEDFGVSGPRMGHMTNWTITWLGTDPGGFEVISTGDSTARFRKAGTSVAGNGYLFKLTAEDSSCSNNKVDSGYYTLNITGEGGEEPYYVGLVGEWHMDECTWDGTAGEILDSSGTGAHGESHNMGTADTSERSVGHDCHCAALNLNGTTNQYVTLGSQAFQNLGDFSLSMWFRMEATSSGINTLFSGARAGSFNNMLIYLDNSASTFDTWINDVQTGTFSIGSSVADGLWHHLVWTRQVSNGKEIVYLDGSPLSDTHATADTSNVSLDPAGVIVGQEQDGLGGNFDVNQVFHGWIDEVMIYNRLVSQSEVSRLYSLSHSCSGSCYTQAVAEYRMDEPSWTTGSASVSDSAGSFDGTPYGNASVNKNDSHLCYAGEFSNSNSYIRITGLPVSTGTEDRTTVCFWMKWNGNYSEMPIGWGSNYDLYFSNGALGFNTACSDVFGVGGVDTLANNWHHVAAVFTNNDPAGNQLYIDGVLQPSTLINGTPCQKSVSSTLYISGWDTTNSYKYNGLIDEVRIYARGLSRSEVVSDMNATHSCPGGP